MLQTTSEVLSFGRELEETSAGFYEELAGKFPAVSDTMKTFAAENRKFVKQVERAYFSVITDAIEGCFAFQIQPDTYRFSTELPEDDGYSAAIQTTLELEEKMIAFYQDASEQSKTLMADIPRTLALIAQKRSSRKAQLLSQKDIKE